MSMEALLHSVGVASNAMGWAAAVSWVLKDGLGSVGMILAAKIMGDNNSFDANTLRAKFRADVAHNLGVALELMTHLFPAAFLLLASVANTVKGVAGLTNGACKASINRQLAIQNNMGDVTAKGFAQGLAAYLTGLSLGVGLNTVVPYLIDAGSLATAFLATAIPGLPDSTVAVLEAGISRMSVLWTVFASLVGIHIWASYRALRSIALRSLNTERTTILLDHFLSLPPDQRTPENLLQPQDLREQQLEHIITKVPSHSRSPKIILDGSIAETFANQSQLARGIATFMQDKYLLQIRPDQSAIRVHFHADALPLDVLRAFVHGFLLRERLLSTTTNTSWTSLGEDALQAEVISSKVENESFFPSFLAGLKAKQWHVDEVVLMSRRPKSRSRWSTTTESESKTPSM
jgi:hypothetical protein